MRFTVRTSGGIANLRIAAEVDTGELEEGLAARAATVTARRVARAAKSEASYPDERSFEVSFPGGRAYVVVEGAADSELVDLLDELVSDYAARQLRDRAGDAASDSAP